MSNFAQMNKGALRQAMREAGLPYTGLNTDAMRAALEAASVATVEPGTPTDDAPMPQFSGSVEEQSEQHIAAMPVAEMTDEDRALLAELEAAEEQVAEVAQEVSIHAASNQLIANALASGELVLPTVAPAPATSPRTTSKGVRIQKDRPTANGVKMPSEGTLCRAVWDEIQRSEDAAAPHTVKTIKTWAEANGTNVNNAAIEFYARRKFYGISGRK